MRFQVSESESSLFQRLAGTDGTLSPPELILGDGRPFPHPGKFENTVNQVNPKTGTLEVQATFANPERTLLPGQFGRIRVQTTEKKGALLVPQRAVTDIQGLQSVMAVGPDNKVVAHHIVTGARVGDRWIVEQGLKAGDRVIVEGLQKAAPGSVVDPKPYQASPASAATGGGA